MCRSVFEYQVVGLDFQEAAPSELEPVRLAGYVGGLRPHTSAWVVCVRFEVGDQGWLGLLNSPVFPPVLFPRHQLPMCPAAL